MYYYAVIEDGTGVCYELAEVETEINNPYYIAIDSYDVSLKFRKKYVNGSWVDTTPAEAMQYNGLHIGLFGKWLDQITGDTGAVKEVLNQNVTAQIASKTAGVYTFSSAAGIAGAPTTSEAYRYLVHKTTSTHGWVIAFGVSGAVYTNYINSGTWTGWKPIYTQDTPLWSGSYQMDNTETVTPSKKLSECAHGWILMWSDWNVESSEPSETDIATTLVPKKNALGSNWTGQSLYALLPTYVTTAQAVTIACKRLNIYNNRVTGFTLNNAEPANDVVLRAIYEY